MHAMGLAALLHACTKHVRTVELLIYSHKLQFPREPGLSEKLYGVSTCVRTIYPESRTSNSLTV